MHTRPYSIIPSFLQFFSIFTIFSTFITCTRGLDRQEYIIYMGHLNKTWSLSPSLLHLSFLQNALDNTSAAKIIYSYKNSFNGFVAELTNLEAERISKMQGVVSVFLNKINHLHTTRSWNYMNFSETVKRQKTIESNIIIGVIDSGIWPESDSFDDAGFGPPPVKWRGSCSGLLNFTCNNKIIGAKYYNIHGKFGKNDIKSPRDTFGHGTHIASIVAGRLVSSANFYGLANGTARGGVPSSRIAVYKVCWSNGCLDLDVLAAFDDAINDGVNIISISLGNDIPANYFSDSKAIGSFHAMAKGILTSIAAGNNGPDAATIANVAPWELTVAASTIGREFITNLTLGNNTTFVGISLNTFDSDSFFPIVYAGDVPNRELNFPGSVSRLCINNSLDAMLVRGKIILCDQMNTGEAAFLAGAAGMVIREFGPINSVNQFPLPTTRVNRDIGNIIMSYLRSTRNPTAKILKSNEILDSSEPVIAQFSSRGPNPITFYILKPDLTAPGVDILAAWTLANSPTDLGVDKRRFPYNIVEGTSMSSPHVSAAAAYVKSFNPSWSPAAIKSALMTTAFKMNPKRSPDAEFSYGAGHVNPVGAIDPGLVYDTNQKDYVQFLCGQGYNNMQLQSVTGDRSITCSNFGREDVLNLNLPSFAARVYASTSFRIQFNRRITNVGSAPSTYKAAIHAPWQLKIQVVPDTLSFFRIGQTLPFTVVVEGRVDEGFIAYAFLTWVSATHKVRSPIVVYA